VETVQQTAVKDSTKVVIDSSYRVEQRAYRKEMKAIALQSLINDSIDNLKQDSILTILNRRK